MVVVGGIGEEGSLGAMVMVIVWPAAAALCVSRFVGFCVPTDSPRSPSMANVVAPPIVTGVSASALVNTK